MTSASVAMKAAATRREEGDFLMADPPCFQGRVCWPEPCWRDSARLSVALSAQVTRPVSSLVRPERAPQSYRLLPSLHSHQLARVHSPSEESPSWPEAESAPPGSAS